MTTYTTTTRGPAPLEAAQALAEAAARAQGTTLDQLRGPARDRVTSAQRHVCMAALVRMGVPLSAVGRALRRDHTTVIAARDRVASDPDLSRLADELAGRTVPPAPPDPYATLAREVQRAAELLEAEGYHGQAARLRLAAEGVGCGEA